MIKFIADWLLVAMIPVVVLAMFVGVPRQQWVKRWSYVVMAGLTALLVARLMGFLPVSLTRPFAEAGVAAGATYMDNPGFPSDHTMLAFAMAFAVLFVSRFKKLGYVLVTVAALIGLGRVLALVHTPLDVIGGVVAACLGALWYLQQRK
jgi:undecaprenyl-diphosphatase